MLRLDPFPATNATVSAHLYPDEELLLAQDSVGLYDGKEKSPLHADGRVHLTTHRVLYVDLVRPHAHSLALSLHLVRQTEYWAGFLKSSAKITLVLGDPPSSSAATASPSTSTSTSTATATATSTSTPARDDAEEAQAGAGPRSWVCRVCGMQNVAGTKCTLCGVSRDAASSSRPVTPSRPSTPSSRLHAPPPLPPPLVPPRPPPPPPPPPLLEEGTRKDPRIPCPTCTFLNHPSMATCELCYSSLASSLPISTLTSLTLAATASSSASPAPSRPATPDVVASSPSSGTASYIRLSFRKGGEKEFYKKLKEALEARKWDLAAALEKERKAGGGGIDAIMKTMEEEERSREEGMEDAFRDLDRLMKNAKEMIALAQTLNERIALAESTSSPLSPSSSLSPSSPPPTSSASSTSAPKSLVSNSLRSIGLVNAPVTADVVSASDSYHRELAKELGKVLWEGQAGVMRDGICGLDEVWCVWNRARGVALVSPSDLTLAAPYLHHLHPYPPLHLRTFASGLTVLHTSKFTLASFRRRLLAFLDLRLGVAQSLVALPGSEVRTGSSSSSSSGGATTLEIAQEEGVSLGLAREMVEEVERTGGVARDEQGDGGTRWFRNFFV